MAGHSVADRDGWDRDRGDWERGYFDHLESDYYWQCHPTTTDPSVPCLLDNAEIPSFSFLSGYQGLQSFPNELLVMLVVPGDAIPNERRWWGW